ncbi:MAG: HPr kinase/phosphatase C-terminal domain-containing protein [Novosphingobium sp.]|nr:HPr kinase/phosphatase C-terminal domain-containing protein [Novosphingobium sp.]
MAIGGRGLLIEGPPGSGKSSLALALIDRGAVLVGDDSVMLEARSGLLLASPHPQTRGLLEIRNLGLVPMPVCEQAPVALLICLEPEAPRFVEQARISEVNGIKVPTIDLWPDSPVLALRSEMALARYGLATC